MTQFSFISIYLTRRIGICFKTKSVLLLELISPTLLNFIKTSQLRAAPLLCLRYFVQCFVLVDLLVLMLPQAQKILALLPCCVLKLAAKAAIKLLVLHHNSRQSPGQPNDSVALIPASTVPLPFFPALLAPPVYSYGNV